MTHRRFLTRHFPAASSSHFFFISGSMTQTIFMLSQHFIKLHSILSTEARISKYHLFTFSDYGSFKWYNHLTVSNVSNMDLCLPPLRCHKVQKQKITSLIAHSTIGYLASSQEWMNHWFKNKHYLLHSHGQTAFLTFTKL